MNVVSFDLEEWYQLAHRHLTGEILPARETILRQMDSVLDVLDKNNTKATFFVLGLVAERFPSLIRNLAAQGHEIACHGYSHWRADRLSRSGFLEDTRKAKVIIEQIVQAPVVGYRATEFSIRKSNLWALEVLAELGFTYDSSIFPIRHRRYGIPGFDPEPKRYRLANGMQIVELPLAAFTVAGIRVPVAGGGYFRLLPLWALRQGFSGLQKRRLPAVTYFHPYEFDPCRLDIFETLRAMGWKSSVRGWRINLRYNLGRARNPGKLSAVLREFEFTTCREFLAHARF
jgi:polysaccharide deacetylase family protein (PEP-CTERM system associated)